LSKLSEDDKQLARKQIAIFKEHYRLFQFGDYYRISSPFDNHEFTAWEYADKEGREAMLSVVFTDQHGNPLPQRVYFKGLTGDVKYRLSIDGDDKGVYSGAALMNGGVLLPVPSENYDSCQIFAKAVE
jgi:alpha-galactosidase